MVGHCGGALTEDGLRRGRKGGEGFGCWVAEGLFGAGHCCGFFLV